MTQIMIELKDEERTKCEIWSRVMGYHRPTTTWNKGKQSEWADRQFFSLSKSEDPVRKMEEWMHL